MPDSSQHALAPILDIRSISRASVIAPIRGALHVGLANDVPRQRQQRRRHSPRIDAVRHLRTASRPLAAALLRHLPKIRAGDAHRV